MLPRYRPAIRTVTGIVVPAILALAYVVLIAGSWGSAEGGFGSIDDLTSVTGIGDKTFDGLKDLVTV